MVTKLLSLFVIGLAPTAGAQGASFQPAVNVAVGGSPEAIVAANLRAFHGDDILDLAVASGDSNSVSVLLGNGDGTFQEPVTYGVGSYPWFIAVADLNGDELPDLVVANRDSGDLTVLIGAGSGIFQVKDNVPLSENPFSTGVADFNSDGFQDLVVTNLTDTFLLLGNGDGTFGPPTLLDGGANARFVAVGDFNGDTIPDLAVTNSRGTDSVTILLGDGYGQFRRVGRFGVG